MAGTTHKTKTRAAPIGGLNARDSIANMGETDAVRLINWIPDTYGVRCRRGFKEWAINFPADAAVTSILPYFSATAAYPLGDFLTAPVTVPGKLFAATDAGIYDITTSTNAPALVMALSNVFNSGWFSHAMFSNAAGAWLLACSEVDGYFTYDGATWLKRGAEVTGVDPAKLVHVNVWKSRAWFVERNSAVVWYLPAAAIVGLAKKIDFGSQFRRGGHLAYTASWTIDAGEGVDDFFVAVSSNGEVLVYKGTDPDAAETFALVGRWPVGQIPVGRRAYSQYGGDLVIASTNGITPLSMVTRGGSDLLSTTNKEYSSKIRSLIGGALRSSFTLRGWQLSLHPTERVFICNSPDHEGVKNSQYVMSTSVNEWSLFNGIPIICLGSVGGYMFAGAPGGRVLILFSSLYDETKFGETRGEAVRGEIIPAYSYFDSPILKKQFMMVRPSFISVSQPSFLADIVVDFDFSTPLGTPVFSVEIPAIWGAALWGGAVFGGDATPFAEWITVDGLGVAGALAMVTSAVGDTTLASIDYIHCGS